MNEMLNEMLKTKELKKKTKKEAKKQSKKLKGFTLAEIIISMSIIGIIAAITIPALLVSTNDKTMNAQKKALEARMSQAISQIEDLRVFQAQGDKADSSSALNFITKGLSKVYRITKTCDKTSLTTTCGFPTDISTQAGDVFDITQASNMKLVEYVNNSTKASAATFGGLNTEVAGFKTANGESVALFYNPSCFGSKTDGFYSGNAAIAMCVNMIYDLNGKDGAPNEVGKDIGFVTVFFPKDADVVVPITYSGDTTGSYSNYEDAVKLCKAERTDLILPTWEEGLSMMLNKKLTGLSASSKYLVSGSGSTGIEYAIDTANLNAGTAASKGSSKIRCVFSK